MKSKTDKTKPMRIAVLVILLVLTYWFHHRMQREVGPLDFQDRSIRISFLLFAEQIDDPATQVALKQFLCRDDHQASCIQTQVKRFYEQQFQMHSRNTTSIITEVKLPVDRRLVRLKAPEGWLAAMNQLFIVIKHYMRRDLNFFDYDVRVMVNIRKLPRYGGQEKSMGSGVGRLGYVEWALVDDPMLSDFMWNTTKVIHEIGHTFGASDKYMGSGKSAYPGGYVDPSRGRQVEQDHIEVMSGTRPLGGDRPEAPPASLDELRVGTLSAREMGWHGDAP